MPPPVWMSKEAKWSSRTDRHVTGPPALLPWGRNDSFFPAEGARAYLDDLPDAELHLLDTGHFATATHDAEIAAMISAFFATRVNVSAGSSRDRPRVGGRAA
mgnify:CR=1 FL=1